MSKLQGRLQAAGGDPLKIFVASFVVSFVGLAVFRQRVATKVATKIRDRGLSGAL
jgi:hypothetical protein